MIFLSRLSIKSQLIIITVVPTLIISVVFYFVTSVALSIFNNDSIQSEASLIGEAVSTNLDYYVQTNNMPEIQKVLCLSLQLSKNIQQISLKSDSGADIATCGTDSSLSTRSVAAVTPIYVNSHIKSQILNREFDRDHKGVLLGYIKVIVTDEFVREPFNFLLLKIAMLGVIVSVLGAVLAYLFSRRFAFILTEVVQAADAISKGACPVSFSAIQGGEIGKLQTAFQTMAKSILESTHSLEARIDDRTIELQYQKKRLEESNAEVKSLIRRLNETIEAERKKIAFDLHDTLNTVVLSAIGHARNARSIISKLPDEETRDSLLEEIASIEMNASYFYRLSRDLVTELRPEVLDEFGLKEALESFIEKQRKIDVNCEYSFTAPEIFPKLNYDFNIVVYRIMQESISNITKHADATRCEVKLSCHQVDEDLAIQLIITDDGKGFDQTIRTGRTGLVSMRERAESIKGTLTIESSQTGTCIILNARFNQRKGKRV